MKEPVVALIDHGSKINLILMDFYKKGKWSINTKHECRIRCRDNTQVRVEMRRDRGGLEPKSKRGWRKKEDRLRRTGDTQGHGPSTQRTRIDADTERR